MNQLDAEETVNEDVAAASKSPDADTTSTTAAPAKPRQTVADKKKAMKEELAKKEKMAKEKKYKEELPPYVDAQAVQHVQERPKVAHAQSHQIVHNEAVPNTFLSVFLRAVRLPLTIAGILGPPRGGSS